MTQVVKCDIFTRFWDARLRELKEENRSLTMDDVFPVVWTPVFHQCEQLLVKLRNHSLSLSEVDTLFCGMEHDSIAQTFKKLQMGVEWCQSRCEAKPDFKWIHPVIFRIEKFRKLSKVTGAAQVLLNIKGALNLTGDFQLIEIIASKVRNTIFYTIKTICHD